MLINSVKLINRVNVLKEDSNLGITQDMVRDLAESYEESGHRAPIVLGHPKDNSPAWGWVKACEFSEGSMFCDLEVTPEFETLLAEGRFRERSVAFYNSTPPVLRHLGFLGATPPRIKGLEPIQLSESTYEGTNVESISVPLETKPEVNMNEFLKPVVMFTLSETFNGLTPNSFKTEPTINQTGDTITGLVTLSDGSEYDYKLVKDSANTWSVETNLANPEVIELSEKVALLEKRLTDSSNQKIVDALYESAKLTEAILPKADCLTLLSESTSGTAVKLFNNLPALVSQVESTPESTQSKAVKSFGNFELAESDLYTQTVERCQALGLNPNNPSDFVKAYRNQ